MRASLEILKFLVESGAGLNIVGGAAVRLHSLGNPSGITQARGGEKGAPRMSESMEYGTAL